MPTTLNLRSSTMTRSAAFRPRPFEPPHYMTILLLCWSLVAFWLLTPCPTKYCRAAVPPASPSSLPLAPSSQHAGAKRKQHPGPSSGSSSSASSRNAARSTLDSKLCAVGEVVSWGGHFVNWSALAAAFTAEHRMPIDDRHKRVLLSVQSSDKAFSSFAPDGASVPTLAALRTWYNGNRWTAFEISG